MSLDKSNTYNMCNGHRFVKSTLFQSPSYLADLSPYISAIISTRLFATPIQLTASAIKPLAPLAQSILPTRATNFILNGTLTCEYCLHQVSQDSFDDGRPCPSLLLEKLSIPESDFILADQLLEAQDRRRLESEKLRAKEQQAKSEKANADSNQPSTSSSSITEIGPRSQVITDVLSYNERDDWQTVEKANNQAHLYKDELLIMQICPEIGLHNQAFKCVDCDTQIDLNSSRLCHYDGRYYCYNCHTGYDLLPIPARVLRSWDFNPKPVSKTSLQKICFLRTKPVLFNLFQVNSMLYGFIDKLVEIKQIRERIQSMLKYLEVCGQGDKPNLMTVPKHFLNGQLLNFFTLNDLFEVNQVYEMLSQLQSTIENHIVRKCESCRGKGYYCELCKDSRDVLYPFSKNSASCSKCHTVYHKNCFHRKKKNCFKCIRINQKKSSLSYSESENSLESISGSNTDHSQPTSSRSQLD